MYILSPFSSSTSSLFRNYNPDLALTVSDGLKTKTFRVHRIVLMSNSHYFRALLSESFQESGQNEIDINETNPDTFSKILDLMYGQNIQFENWIDKLDVLVLVQFFQIEGIDVDESLCHLDLKPKDIPKYFTYIQHFYPQTLPLHLSQCIGGMIETTDDLQKIPIEYRLQLVSEENNEATIIKNRLIQLSTCGYDNPIKYFRFTLEHYVNIAYDSNTIFSGRNKEEALIKFNDYIYETTRVNTLFSDDVIDDAKSTMRSEMELNGPLNKFDIDTLYDFIYLYLIPIFEEVMAKIVPFNMI